jgi:hypothetical protein
MKKFLFNYVLPYFLYVLILIWCWTIRESRKTPEAEDYVRNLSGNYILTLWHGRIFYLFYYLRRRPDFHLLISPSQDGDLLAKLARLMGYSVVRGSTFKKAVSSARSLVKLLRRGERVIVIADGSRGPRLKAQAGSIQIAGITDSPIIPMTYGTTRKGERKDKSVPSAQFYFTPGPISHGYDRGIGDTGNLDGTGLSLKAGTARTICNNDNSFPAPEQFDQ